MRKEKNEKRYKRIIWDAIVYLFVNRKSLAKELAEQKSDEWGSKLIRFGTALEDFENGYVIDFKISE